MWQSYLRISCRQWPDQDTSICNDRESKSSYNNKNSNTVNLIRYWLIQNTVWFKVDVIPSPWKYDFLCSLTWLIWNMHPWKFFMHPKSWKVVEGTDDIWRASTSWEGKESGGDKAVHIIMCYWVCESCFVCKELMY